MVKRGISSGLFQYIQQLDLIRDVKGVFRGIIMQKYFSYVE